MLQAELTAAEQSPPEHTVGANLRLHAGFIGDKPEASAHSARAAVNWRATWSESWLSRVAVNAIATDNSHYFDGVIDNGFAKIPDAQGLNLTEASIHHFRPGNELVLGRQTLQLLDGRLVGNNGFWQKPQVFDAITIDQALGGQVEISTSYIWQANRIGGRLADHDLHRDDLRFQLMNGERPADELGEHSLNSWMLEGAWRSGSNTIKLVSLNHKNRDLNAHDNSTAGLNFHHAAKHGRWRLNAIATGLIQSRLDQAIPYYDLQLHLKEVRFGISVQRETLGTSQNISFITPLASLHDFQGMTDQYLSTPTSGLHDNNLSFLYRSKLFGSITAKGHYFESYTGRALGKELSIEWSKALEKHLKMNLRAAQFAKSNERDVWKVFITIEQKFGQM